MPQVLGVGEGGQSHVVLCYCNPEALTDMISDGGGYWFTLGVMGDRRCDKA